MVKKLIAPIVITSLLAIYFTSFIITCFFIEVPLGAKIIGIIVPLIFIGISIFVLIERIKEVRSGEEDDLSKY